MSRWNGIVLHHSATEDTPGVETEAFRRYHKEIKEWRDIGYHWVIEDVDDIYEVLMGRPAYMSGAHCIGKNRDHLGVCFTGNFDLYEMGEEQLVVGVRLIAGLCVMNDIRPSFISCHKDWWDTDCPGAYFPLDEIVDGVTERIGVA
jgi:N-acetylmuramoyl-L-alanine amidase